ncbi:hypothetical protein [Peptacetobacter hiranonis]|uniref:Lipoprotein n=1 Tax=Peptacetobacter hiranonis (strain DSM 13275 / JCM 10541 / KCTC 15199 / TO-931) TaxID=500633 RepID=B6FYN9_PEPHT|nr:hypothetical protein [Peptacetobacter hiranonis]EEA85395.1 hypothetical protein CLOHIR_00992 [Peptacetobacter hiranonis DSM 13275]QEK20287.1 hypothetical protein KGNDJEFE_00770 [Peptacetobacter hiranonis]
MLRRVKSLALCAVLAFSVFATGCTKDLVTKVTDKNVNGIVSDYTQVYKYYEKLRKDMLSIDKLRHKGGSEKTAQKLTADIEKNLTKVKDLDYKYDNMYNAQKYLEKCYKDIKKASEGAIGNHDKYDKNIVKFKENFGEFKRYMALARADISKVRGTSDDSSSVVEEENTTNTDDASTADTENSTEEKDANDIITGVVEDVKNRNKGEELDADLESAIKENGFLSGQEYKANGGSEANLEKEAKKMFDELENDNPIKATQKSKAKRVFINAFKEGYADYQ